MGTKKRTKVPGHKRDSVVRSVQVVCECGWSTGHHAGPGALKEARRAYHRHLEQQEHPYMVTE